GRPLSRDDQISILFTVISAGFDTTSAALSAGIAILAQDVDMWKLLATRPELLDGAVEEVLRLGASAANGRTVTEPADLDGQTMCPGDKVLLEFAAANFDPEVFPDPTQFDPTREHNPHLTLGFGAHLC